MANITAAAIRSQRSPRQGFGAINIGIDPATHLIYTTQPRGRQPVGDQRRQLQRHPPRRCRKSPEEDAVGNYPFAIAIDSGADSAYVVNNADISLVPLGP
jgi:hypothetical protein